MGDQKVKAVQLAFAMNAGWASDTFDAMSGVVGRGGLSMRVDNSPCERCRRSFIVGDSLVAVTLAFEPQRILLYHESCLPDQYASHSQFGSK